MLAIIPARGGSKGLPDKNIKSLNGKPLIAYTIEAAIKAKKVSRVIVSTNDDTIAKIAREYNAEIPFMRPTELSTDKARSVDVFDYTLKRLEDEEGRKVEDFVVLQPTSPLRVSENIDEAINLFQTRKADSVVSYCPEHHPIAWHKYIDEMGKLVDIFKSEIRNRQDERVTYYPNGAIFVFKKWLIEKKQYYTDNSYAYIMDRNQSVDIDTIEDFEYAEFLVQKRDKQKL